MEITLITSCLPDFSQDYSLKLLGTIMILTSSDAARWAIDRSFVLCPKPRFKYVRMFRLKFFTCLSGFMSYVYYNRTSVNVRDAL